MRALLVTASSVLFALLSACGSTPCADARCADGAPEDDDDQPADEDPIDDGEDDLPALTPVGATEHDIGYGWVGAAQPSEARLAEVVATGALVISLRPESEDPFNEEQVVTDLGGAFVRYPTVAANYEDVSFREGMYDLYDGQMDAGGPVYLHCASSNRVGASWALYHAERKGLSAEDAIQRGKDAGLASLESMVRDILGVP